MNDWQTPAALAVVALTVLLFLFKKKKTSCGSDCSCPTKGVELPRSTNADEDSKCPPK